MPKRRSSRGQKPKYYLVRTMSQEWPRRVLVDHYRTTSERRAEVYQRMFPGSEIQEST